MGAVAPRTLDSNTTPESGASAAHEYNGSNAISSPGLGADFRCIRCIGWGPAADPGESTDSKVLALGPTLNALAPLYGFDALDSEAPEGPVAGTWI